MHSPMRPCLCPFVAVNPSFRSHTHSAIRPRAKQKHDPLTEAQVEKIREAGIDPNERIKLYTEYLNDHVNAVKGLTNRGKSEARAKPPRQRIAGRRNLMDELGSNLDEYSDRHADIRGALKTLVG